MVSSAAAAGGVAAAATALLAHQALSQRQAPTDDTIVIQQSVLVPLQLRRSEAQVQLLGSLGASMDPQWPRCQPLPTPGTCIPSDADSLSLAKSAATSRRAVHMI